MINNDVELIPHPTEKTAKKNAVLSALSDGFTTSYQTKVVTKIPYSNLSRDLPLVPIDLGSCREVTFLRTRRGLGDMVSLLGAISAFAEKHPHVKITLMGEEPIVSIAQHHKSIDRIISAKEDLNLNSRIVDLSNPGPCATIEGYFRSPEPGNRALLFGAAIGLNKTHRPELVVTEAEKQWARDWFAHRGLQTPVGVVYQTASSTKNFQNILELFQRIQWDFDAYLIEHAELFEGVEPTTQGLTVRQQAALISQSKVVITPDTGWLHVAGAHKIPLVGLFGSYPAQQTMSIYGVPALAITGYCPMGQQPCRGKIYCKYDANYDHPPCLKQSVAEVFPQIQSFLQRYAV